MGQKDVKKKNMINEGGHLYRATAAEVEECLSKFAQVHMQKDIAES